MNVLRRLRKQMRVISNHRYKDSVGGYAIYFVGTGQRDINFSGWWRTKLDFYSLDVAGLSQQVRVQDDMEFRREENTVSLFTDNISFEEQYETPCKFDDAWIVFRPLHENHPLKRIVSQKGYCLFKDDHHVIREKIHEAAHIANPDAGQRLMAQAAFLQILAHFCQATSTPSSNIRRIAPLVPRRENPNTFKSRVLSILGSDLRNDLSVEELAGKLSISRSTLSHRFSSEMGETMVQLKNRLRIQRAQELMQTPDKQLKEIAFETGFDDPAYFTRLFTKMAGVSPSGYRKLISKGHRAPTLQG